MLFCLPSPHGRETYCFSSCVCLSVSLSKSCERNSSYSFSRNFLKRCMHFCQGLKMCMPFACYPQMHFGHFFRSSDLINFGLQAFSHWVSCERDFSFSFTQILSKRCRCFCQGLKMCVTFGCNPQINFCHLFHSSDLVIFGLKAFRQCVSC